MPIPIWLVSRIFSPEPAAASGRLVALTRALVQAGAQVQVLTVTEPSGQQAEVPPQVVVHRAPVLRDKSGYVRGVVQYLSFDIPLAGRLLARGLSARGSSARGSSARGRPKVIIVEPPPTTGAVVRVVAKWLGVPYVYYAADIWHDALAGTAVSKPLRRIMSWIERFAMRGAALVLTVSDETTQRVRELAGHDRIQLVPHGVDTSVFSPTSGELDAAGRLKDGRGTPVDLLYAGMASERHGALVFIEALAQVLQVRPSTTCLFMGYGSDWENLQARARELGIAHAVKFMPAVPAPHVAGYLRNAKLALASLAPNLGYDYAFPTKIYAALACGVPVVFSGVGPAAELLRDQRLGYVAGADPAQVAGMIMAGLEQRQATTEEAEEEAMRIVAWVRKHRSIETGAEAAAAAICKLVPDA